MVRATVAGTTVVDAVDRSAVLGVLMMATFAPLARGLLVPGLHGGEAKAAQLPTGQAGHPAPGRLMLHGPHGLAALLQSPLHPSSPPLQQMPPLP